MPSVPSRNLWFQSIPLQPPLYSENPTESHQIPLSRMAVKKHTERISVAKWPAQNRAHRANLSNSVICCFRVSCAFSWLSIALFPSYWTAGPPPNDGPIKASQGGSRPIKPRKFLLFVKKAVCASLLSPSCRPRPKEASFSGKDTGSALTTPCSVAEIQLPAQAPDATHARPNARILATPTEFSATMNGDSTSGDSLPS